MQGLSKGAIYKFFRSIIVFHDIASHASSRAISRARVDAAYHVNDAYVVFDAFGR